MTDAAPAPAAPFASLRARLDRLAADPRARLLPDGRNIALEITAALVALELIERRLVALETIVANLHRATFGGPDCE